MTCPRCAALLRGAPALCPLCGQPILEEDRTFPLAFEGDTLEFPGWLLLSILSAVLFVPLAWTLAAMGRWFCRNVRIHGNITLAFQGTGPEILGWMALSAVLWISAMLGHLAHIPRDFDASMSSWSSF